MRCLGRGAGGRVLLLHRLLWRVLGHLFREAPPGQASLEGPSEGRGVRGVWGRGQVVDVRCLGLGRPRGCTAPTRRGRGGGCGVVTARGPRVRRSKIHGSNGYTTLQTHSEPLGWTLTGGFCLREDGRVRDKGFLKTIIQLPRARHRSPWSRLEEPR